MMRALELQQLMVASDAARLGATSNSECVALFYSICREADVLQNMAALPGFSPERTSVWPVEEIRAWLNDPLGWIEANRDIRN